MKYVIMCGGNKDKPKALYKVNGEVLVERTIRMLKARHIEDIVVTVNSDKFDYLKNQVSVVENKNNTWNYETKEGSWLSGFMNFEEPTCYLFGDVYFSDYAMDKIVNTYVDTHCLFGNTHPTLRPHEESFAYKVRDYKKFFKTIDKVLEMKKQGLVNREPIVWELYRVLNNYNVNTHIISMNYYPINDYTSDVDVEGNIANIERNIK